MAGYISELTDIELTEIIPVVPYTEDDLNWRNEESRTFKEFKDNTIRPEIETQINIDNYDTIYLWFPIWFGITPNLILTLLENYDFSGKNIILFCTSEHVGIMNFPLAASNCTSCRFWKGRQWPLNMKKIRKNSFSRI